MSWWHYLLLVNLYLVLFFGFYRVFLHRETFFQLNRAYLVSGSLLSFLIPLMQSDWIRQLFITQRVHQTIYAAVNPQFIYQVKPVESNPITLGQITACIYIIVAVFLFTRLIYQLLSLKKLANRADAPVAFSFFKKIRVDESFSDQQTIIEHEQVHSRQWHSADVLLIEAVMIINWFNPVVYFYRKAIKHVHEYIADRKAIEIGTSKAEYALLLLSQTFGAVPHQLTNNFFNHSLLKQRIMMLNQNESSRRALLKYGLSAPLFAAMLVFSSATVNNSKIIRIINKKTDQAFLIKATNLKDSLKFTLTQTASANPTTVEVTYPGANTSENNSKGQYISKAEIATVQIHQDTIDQPNNSPVYNAVEINPTFPGGEEGFGKFLHENIRYPARAKENQTQGRVFLQFVVEKDGSLSGIKTLRDPGDGLAEEAARVLSESPKWLPGIQNGRTVRVQYTVPINFSMDESIKIKTTDTAAKASPEHKKIMVFVYNHIPGDSLAMLTTQPGFLGQKITSIRMNGKTITKEELSTLNPKDIRSINIIRRDTSKASGEPTKVNYIFIKSREGKAASKT